MALRSVVRIDEEKCNGCGDCIPSCAEGAIQLIDGKARLLADHLCDGLGACLGECPQDAITVEEREADAYDEVAVHRHLQELKVNQPADLPMVGHGNGGGCPGSRTMQFAPVTATAAAPVASPSTLRQWPVQLHLVSPEAPYFQGADVLLAADCTAYAAGDFHSTHLNGKSLAVACPKLDQQQDIYLDKLVAMIDGAHIDTLTVLVMEVPCCSGLVHLAAQAAERAQRKVPVKHVIVGLNGSIKSEEWL